MADTSSIAAWLRRGTLEYCVLALLANGPRYGVELVRHMAADRVLTASEGTLYPLLSRLRRTGWVDTTWQESPVGPPRRYYTLTGEGQRALAQFRVEWVAFRDALDRVMGTIAGAGSVATKPRPAPGPSERSLPGAEDPASGPGHPAGQIREERTLGARTRESERGADAQWPEEGDLR